MPVFSKCIYLFLGLSLILNGEISGQKTNINTENVIPFTIFKTQNKSISLQDLAGSSQKFSELNDSFEKTHPDDIFWIKLDLKKVAPLLNESSSWYLIHNSFDYGTLFYQKNDSILKKDIGRFNLDNAGQRIKSSKYFAEVKINQDTLINDRFIFLKVQQVLFIDNLKHWKFTVDFEPSKDIFSWEEVKRVLPIYIFSGVAGLMAVIMLVFFGYFKKAEFFLYSFYVSFLLLFVLKDDLQLFNAWLPNNMLLKVWLLENIALFVGVGYMYFMIYYLNLKKNYRFAYFVIITLLGFHAVYLIVDILFYVYDYYIGHIFLVKALPIFDTIFGGVAILHVLITTRNLIGYLFVAGSATFMFSVASHFYLGIDIDTDPLRYYNKLNLIIGSTVEIVIFAFGLTYKMFVDHVERLNFQQEAFINKNKALRAQVNPHFIFNALSSIRHLVSIDNKKSALKYLSKFSRLTRNILESSLETNVVLNEEIIMIQDYLELESLRFDNAFSYTINIDENLNIDDIEVPFMILQPFVENAIIHGLLPKKGNHKELVINFIKGTDVVICEIDDNGVGRQAAKKRLHIYQKEKKSRGIELTIQRLESLGKNQDCIAIIDKIDDTEQPAGTKVILEIPL
ncbi:sensor histidine kinase [Allomuricauda sp. F6463D]|uniref:sensor histidine kinase n=1 Tax=Allomuricauda sp. F6463D TaxID=2926409 RepID=UPI001FF509A2|nr:histidine kinase [Muricauda sp. F6463D]MCK0161148.1 histidine kinase [Muricauda sp. F6463D]